MPSAVQSKQITLPFTQADTWAMENPNPLKQWTKDKLSNVWVNSVAQIYTPGWEQDWTHIETLFMYASPKVGLLVKELLDRGCITLVITEKTTPDWKGVTKHPWPKRPSRTFKNEYQATLLYQNT